MTNKQTASVLGLALFAAAACAETFEAVRFRADLSSLNNSGVTGSADIRTHDDSVVVGINATGLTPDQIHSQHIHGLGNDKEARCPDRDQDTNRDGLIDLQEAEAAYGKSTADLTPFPKADSDGRVNLRMTYRAEEAGYPFQVDPEELANLEDQVIVLYGTDVGDTYRPEIPAACGTLETVE